MPCGSTGLKVCIPDIYVLRSETILDNMIWVDPENGNDSTGNGSLLKPFESVSRGLLAIDEGDGDVLNLGSSRHVITGYTSIGAQPLLPMNAYMLKLGSGELLGRDIVITGNGATLYFDQGDDQLEVASFWILAKFRSLTIRGIRFERDGTIPRESAPAAEPNFNDLVMISCFDDREIELIDVSQCSFVNGHKSLALYSKGWDMRDKVKTFRFTGNQVLQPYGSNIDDEGGAPYGGGQQLSCDSWVYNSIITGNDFDGGPTGVTSENPSGQHKDGSFFGNPRNLIFSNNYVRRMGVEAIYHTPNYLFMDYFDDGFTMPAVNSNVTVALNGVRETTFEVGQEVFVKNTGVFEVVARVGADLEIKNLGGSYNVAPTTVVDAGLLILSNERSPSRAVISNNVVLNSVQIAIVSAVRSIISDNEVNDAGVGVTIYTRANSEVFDDGAFSVIEGNNITITEGDGVNYTYGINTAGISFGATVEGAANVSVKGNTITSPSNVRCYGINARGDDWTVEGNQVFALETTAQGPSAPTRGLGIVAYGSRCIAKGNRTGGWDIGVSPESGFTEPFRVIHHEDTTSVLGVALDASVYYVPIEVIQFAAHNNGVAFPVTNWDTAYTDLIMSTAEKNVGGHYNTSTGYFLTPRAGLYEFGVNAVWTDDVSTSSANEIWLEQDGAGKIGILSLHGDPLGSNRDWNGSIRIFLESGLNVKLRITQRTGSTKNLNGAQAATRIWGQLIA